MPVYVVQPTVCFPTSTSQKSCGVPSVAQVAFDRPSPGEDAETVGQATLRGAEAPWRSCDVHVAPIAQFDTIEARCLPFRDPRTTGSLSNPNLSLSSMEVLASFQDET